MSSLISTDKLLVKSSNNNSKIDAKKLRELFQETKAKNEKSQKELFDFFHSSESLEDLIFSDDKQEGSEMRDLIFEIRAFASCVSPYSIAGKTWAEIFGLNNLHSCAAVDWVEGFDAVYKSAPTGLRLVDKLGYNPLYDAIMQNKEKVQQFYKEKMLIQADTCTKYLVEEMVTIGAGTEEKQSAKYMSLLHLAVRLGDISFVKKVIQKGNINLFCADEEGYWPIHYALHYNRQDMIPLLYDAKMKRTPNKNGNFLMHVLMLANRYQPYKMQILKQLLALGEEINQVSNNLGATVLAHILLDAIQGEVSPLGTLRRRLELAEEVLGMGVNIDQMAAYGSKITTRIEHVTREFSFDAFSVTATIRFLADKISGIELCPSVELTDEMLAAATREIEEYACKIDPVEITLNSQNLLHACVEAFPKESKSAKDKSDIIYYLTVMQFLIKNGIDIEAENIDGETSLKVAEDYQLAGVIYLLTQYHKKLSVKKQRTRDILLETPVDQKFTPLILQYLYRTASETPEADDVNSFCIGRTIHSSFEMSGNGKLC